VPPSSCAPRFPPLLAHPRLSPPHLPPATRSPSLARPQLTDIAASLETDASNPSLQAENWFLNKSYTGSAASPVAVFERGVVANIGEYCVLYARDGTVSGTILGMSFGSLEIKLNEATASLTAGNKLYVYSCCNVVYDPSPFTGGRSVPYTCPNGELYSLALDAAAEKIAAAAAISAASQGGVGSLSTSSGQRCDDGISGVGDWRVNNSATGQLNCTCTAPEGGFGAYTWNCVSIYGSKRTMWRDGAIIAVVMVGVIAVLIVAVALGYVCMQRDKSPRPSQFGSVKFAGEPGSTTSQDTYM
jgi:energy-converting hydrogenase Eha subunit A